MHNVMYWMCLDINFAVMSIVEDDASAERINVVILYAFTSDLRLNVVES